MEGGARCPASLLPKGILPQAQAQFFCPAGSRPLFREHHKSDGHSTKNKAKMLHLWAQDKGNLKTTGDGECCLQRKYLYLTALLFLMTLFRHQIGVTPFFASMFQEGFKINYEVNQVPTQEKNDAIEPTLSAILPRSFGPISLPTFPHCLGLKRS